MKIVDWLFKRNTDEPVAVVLASIQPEPFVLPLAANDGLHLLMQADYQKSVDVIIKEMMAPRLESQPPAPRLVEQIGPEQNTVGELTPDGGSSGEKLWSDVFRGSAEEYGDEQSLDRWEDEDLNPIQTVERGSWHIVPGGGMEIRDEIGKSEDGWHFLHHVSTDSWENDPEWSRAYLTRDAALEAAQGLSRDDDLGHDEGYGR